MNAKFEENNENLKQIEGKMENFNKELRENLESKIELVNNTLSQRVREYKEEAEKKLIETNQRLDKTEEKMELIKTGIDARMEKEEQNNQVRVMAIRQENNDQLDLSLIHI